MAGRIVRWAPALGLGALWWWAVLRLALVPGTGAAEVVVAAGGWGLSVLPVHCAPRERARGAVGAGCWRRAWRAVRGARGAARVCGETGPGRGSAAGQGSAAGWPRG